MGRRKREHRIAVIQGRAKPFRHEDSEETPQLSDTERLRALGLTPATNKLYIAKPKAPPKQIIVTR